MIFKKPIKTRLAYGSKELKPADLIGIDDTMLQLFDEKRNLVSIDLLRVGVEAGLGPVVLDDSEEPSEVGLGIPVLYDESETDLRGEEIDGFLVSPSHFSGVVIREDNNHFEVGFRIYKK